MQTLKVATYNIHKSVGLDRKRDPERIIAVLREINADIIALQEADLRIGQRASTIPRALLDDTHWRALPVNKRRRSLGWHGNALLVRRDIDLINCEPVDLPMLEPRGAVSADLNIAGQAIRVIGAHLDLSGLRRRDQIAAILGHCQSQEKSLPTIIMGDFNQWGQTGGALREFGPEWRALAPGRSFPSWRPIVALDRIVVSSEIMAEKAGVHRSSTASVASDHLPVWVSLALHKI